MISHFRRAGEVGVLLLVISLAPALPVHGQIVGGGAGRGQGRREGNIVLPTPPFNPNAGILRSPKGRARKAPQVTPRRPLKRSANSRNPRPRTPRQRRVRRGTNRR